MCINSVMKLYTPLQTCNGVVATELEFLIYHVKKLESRARESYFNVNTLESIALLNVTHLKIVLLNLVT